MWRDAWLGDFLHPDRELFFPENPGVFPALADMYLIVRDNFCPYNTVTFARELKFTRILGKGWSSPGFVDAF